MFSCVDLPEDRAKRRPESPRRANNERYLIDFIEEISRLGLGLGLRVGAGVILHRKNVNSKASGCQGKLNWCTGRGAWFVGGMAGGEGLRVAGFESKAAAVAGVEIVVLS